MPDWGRILRDRADFGSLDVHRERELVAELSAELDDIYREALARGADAEGARTPTRRVAWPWRSWAMSRLC